MADYILNMGGVNNSAYSSVVDVFQVTNSSVAKRNDLNLALITAHSSLAAAACGDYILAMGGANSSAYSSVVDVFQVTSSGVEAVTGHGLTLSQARGGLVAASAGDYILAMGGQAGSSSYSSVVDVFHVTASGVEALTDHGLSLSQARANLVAAACGEYILAMGGYTVVGGGYGSVLDTVDVFHVTSSGVEKITDHGLSLSTPCYGLAAASAGDYILAMGGTTGPDSPGQVHNTVDVFHVTASGIEKITDHGLTLSTARYSLSAASAGGYILAMGGWTSTTSSTDITNTVDVFQILN